MPLHAPNVKTRSVPKIPDLVSQSVVDDAAKKAAKKRSQVSSRTNQKIDTLIKDFDAFKKDINEKSCWLLDEFEQLKVYFRKGTRPSQQKAIDNFEKHLKELSI